MTNEQAGSSNYWRQSAGWLCGGAMLLGLWFAGCSSASNGAYGDDSWRVEEQQLRILDQAYPPIHVALAQGNMTEAAKLISAVAVPLNEQPEQKLACLAFEAGAAKDVDFFLSRIEQQTPGLLPIVPCNLPRWAQQLERTDLTQVVHAHGLDRPEAGYNVSGGNGEFYVPGERDPESTGVDPPPIGRRWMMLRATPIARPEAVAFSATGACFPPPAVAASSLFASKDVPDMSASQNPFRAPTTSPRLDTLSIVSVGLSLDVYRQGQVWAQLQQQDGQQSESLHVGSILPMDPKKYPIAADDKDAAWEKRMADALELGVSHFPEAWPIPTITVVRGWNLNTPHLRFTPDETEASLTGVVDDLRGDAGLHWHRFEQLQNGTICSDTPEDTVENIFRAFEEHPDMPALLVYVVEGKNMAYALAAKGAKIIGGGTGPRQPGELTDTMVALVVARPERMNWLRHFAPYTKVNGEPLYPGFSGWERQPDAVFRPSPFLPDPWTKVGFEQWDALKVLAQLHRPVTVSLNGIHNTRLSGEALTAALASGWNKVTAGVAPLPTRLFFDSGKPNQSLAELMPALKAASSSLDLLQSKESYDLTQRLGDTGAASPFVGIVLATMASYQNADTSVVMPLRRGDQATFITITSATPGKPPKADPFGVNLMPQTTSEGY